MWIDTPKLIDIDLTFKNNETLEQAITIFKKLGIKNYKIYDLNIYIYELEAYSSRKHLLNEFEKQLPRFDYFWTESCEYDY